MLDVRRLRLLRELAHRETIAAVADALGYTPSAVSQQLAALEREAGVPLLERTGRRVALTSAALALVDYAEQILALLEQASAMLAATRGEVAGPLRIGAFPTAVCTILPNALIALGREHPALDLTVIELDPAAAPNALRSERVDVALVHDYDYVPAETDPSLEREPLLEETIYLASMPKPGLREGPGPDDPADVTVASCREAQWIVGSPDTLCYEMAIRTCQAAGFTPRIRHHADDFATTLALVAADQGVALIPRLGALTPPAGVVLTPLTIRRRTAVAFRRGRRLDPAVDAFIAAIRASAAEWSNDPGR